MLEEKDPALEQETAETESADESGTTVAVPPVTEGEAEESSEKSEEGGASPEEAASSQEDQIEIMVEGEAPPTAKEGSVVLRDLRKRYRDSEAKREELERTLATVQGRTAQAADPGPEPTLASSGYDEELFKAEHARHLQAKALKAQRDQQLAQQAEAGAREIRSLEDRYKLAKAELSKGIPDYADRERAVIAALSPAHQDALLKATDNAALVVGYIGRNPTVLDELAKEMDRDRFVAKISKLEVKLKMSKKNTSAPPAEKKISGGGGASPSGAADTKLEQLRAKAEKTGDYTAVNAYKRSLRK